MEKSGFEYYAFISYSHVDESWAKWLQRRLEAYRFPTSLRKNNQSLPKKLFPIFRDETDLVSGELWDKLKTTLNNSEYLIVVCSPTSANSKYVNQEVEYFRSIRGNDKIIPFIIKGTPNAENKAEECFCPALKDPTMEELLGVSVKELGKQKSLLRLIATITHLRFDSLVRREAVRRRKRITTTAIAAIFLICCIAGAFKLMLSPERSEKIAIEANAALESGQPFEALEFGKSSFDSLVFPKETSAGTVALRSALATTELNSSKTDLHEEFRIDTKGRALTILGALPDNSAFWVTDGSSAEKYDLQTGKLLERFQYANNKEKLKELTDVFGLETNEDGTPVFLDGEYVFKDYSKCDLSKKYDVETDGKTLVLKRDDFKKEYKNVDTEKLSYCFNAEENVFAFYNRNESCIYVENLETGLNKKIKVAKINGISLSNKGNLLYIAKRTSEDDSVMGSYSIEEQEHWRFYDISGDVVVKSFDTNNYGYGMSDLYFGRDTENYFFSVEHGNLIKYAFEDKVPLTDKNFGSTRALPVSDDMFTSQNFNSIQLSTDGKVTHTAIEKIEYGVSNTTTYHLFFETSTGKLLWSYTDETETLEDYNFGYDDNMTLAFTKEGKIIDIRSGKEIYSDYNSLISAAGISNDGTKGYTLDILDNVYLFEIEGKSVKKHMLLDAYDDLLYPNDDYSKIVWVGIYNDYFVVQSEAKLYFYDYTKKSLKTADNESFGMANGTSFNKASFESGGLFFWKDYSALNIYNPKTDSFLKLPEGNNCYSFSYSEKSHLLCVNGSQIESQNSADFNIYRYENGKFTYLYTKTMDNDSHIRFSDDGKYLIYFVEQNKISKSSSTVTDAQTGEVLLETEDHLIAIAKGMIYDTDIRCVPAALPKSKWYSLEDLKKAVK